MAGSRLEKLGSIFTRIQGLLRSGALKYEEKPLWYEIYKRFPPRTTPIYHREVPKDEVKTLLYSEDLIRARFFNEFTHNPDLVDLSDDNKKLLISQRFIQKYNVIKTDKVSGDSAFDMAKSALKVEGVILRSLEDVRNEEVEKMKAEAKARQLKRKDSEQQAVKRHFSAADIFGDAAKRRDDDDEGDNFIDEEFFNSAEVEELLQAPSEQDNEDTATERHRKPAKSKPNVKH
jgi:small subunit ribosomal protein S23